MSIPQVGLFRDEKHRYWWNGSPEGGMPGVTSVLRVIDKPAIGTWAKQETAKCAVRNYDLVGTLIKEGGPDAAVAWLSRIPDYQKDTAGKLGSAVHRLAEMIARGEDALLSDEERPFAEAYGRFLADYGLLGPPRNGRKTGLVSLEKGVLNLTAGYGGTFDLIFRLDGENWLCDLKTSKGTYKETALQLAAYGFAEFAGLPGDPKQYRMPRIDRYAVLHLRPDAYEKGYRLVEYRVGPEEFAAFCAALSLSKWNESASPIGETVKEGKVA